MWMILDKDATMITRNVQYYIWLMRQFPEMVEKYLQFGKDNSYDVVYLLAVLDSKDTNQEVV